MIRIIISDTENGSHATAVKAAISAGYGSDISDQIEIRTAGLADDLAYADSIGAIAVVRSTTGYSSFSSLAQSFYPDILTFMPLGSNSFVELSTEFSPIVSAGAGDAENKNNTGYGSGLEFWDIDLETTVPGDLSSFSNGIIAGKILKIKDTLDCTWWEARYRARITADRTEDNRPVETVWHKYNGFGKINVSNAVAYTDTIITDPYMITIPVPETAPEEEPLSETEPVIIMYQNIYIDAARRYPDTKISFFRGDTHTVNFFAKRSGVITDLTGYTAVLSAKRLNTDTAYSFNIQGSNISYDYLQGKITVTFPPAVTAALEARDYEYDIQLSDGTNVYTLASGTLELKPDITRSDLTFVLSAQRFGIPIAMLSGNHISVTFI